MAFNPNLRKQENPYRIKTENRHLKNIIESNYFIELGSIGVNKMTKILNGQVFDIKDICDYDLAVEGVGQISSDRKHDLDYQLLYLLQLRQKASTHKFFLTYQILRYFNLEGKELFAPIILIPVDIDIKGHRIIKSGAPVINDVIITELQVYLKEAIILPERLNTLDQIHSCIQELCKKTGLDYRVGNYLTHGGVEYIDKVDGSNEERFDTQRSIYELTDREIRASFYQTINAVLPTNVQQKNIMLKAKKGENFVVVGRYGSGKTHTIINILADFARANKRVLYINQDMDNIGVVSDSLQMLDLSPLVLSLCDFSQVSTLDAAYPKMVFSSVDQEELSIDVLKPLEDFEDAFNQKIHGFRYQEIVNQMAIIRNTFPKLTSIQIESILEKQEVQDVCRRLGEIEVNLKEIDPISINLWREVEVFYTEKHAPEIEVTLRKYCQEQMNFNLFIKKFVQAYSIKMPENAWDAHRLINIIGFFRQVPPPTIWINPEKFLHARQAIQSLSTIKQRIKELKQAYSALVQPEYVRGFVDDYLKIIRHPRLVNQNEVTINNLLGQASSLKEIASRIESKKLTLLKSLRKVLPFFGIKEGTSDFFSFLPRIISLLGNDYLYQKWFEDYLINPKQHFGFNSSIISNIQKWKELQATIVPYLYKPERLKYENLKMIYHNKAFIKLMHNNLDHKAMREKRITQEEVGRLIISYAEIVHSLYEAFASKNFPTPSNFEDVLLSYDQYLVFVNDIQNDLEHKLLWDNFLRNHFNNQKKRDSLNEAVLPKDYYQITYEFGEEVNHTTGLVDSLNVFAIEVEGKTIIERMENCNVWLTYIKKVAVTAESFAAIWKKGYTVTFNDLIYLANLDREYEIHLDSLDKDRNYYIGLLGDSYQGLETDCDMLLSLSDTFSKFQDRVLSLYHLRNLFARGLISQMTDLYNDLIAQYESFYEAHRQFGRYFVGGASHLLELPLEAALSEIELRYTKKDQLGKIMTIYQHLNILKKHGLVDLTRGIKESRYTTGLESSYMFSTLQLYHDATVNSFPILTKPYNAIEWIDNYQLFERQYCSRNQKALIEEIASRKTVSRNNHFTFNDYNHLIQEDKNKLIVLANLNTFNSNLDLSIFDLVIIDDCHLGSANKYHRIYECKQLIAFGDETFRYNIHASFLNRIETKYKIALNRRYLEVIPRFNNRWSVKDQFINNGKVNVEIFGIQSIDMLARNVVDYYNQDMERIIHIVTASDETRRHLFTSVISLLSNNHSVNEIIMILSRHLRIISSSSEGCTNATDVFFFYEDFKMLESRKKLTILKNYSFVKDRVVITYISKPVSAGSFRTGFGGESDENHRTRTEISNLVGAPTSYQKTKQGINQILIDGLIKRNIQAKTGFGRFDVVIQNHSYKDSPKIGIIIEGNDLVMPYSIIDDYKFYYGQYIKYGWQVVIFYIEDLVKNLEEKLDEIQKMVSTKSPLGGN